LCAFQQISVYMWKCKLSRKISKFCFVYVAWKVSFTFSMIKWFLVYFSKIDQSIKSKWCWNLILVTACALSMMLYLSSLLVS
jgi:hypothetical protein